METQSKETPKKVLHLSSAGKDLTKHKKIPLSLAKTSFVLLNDNNESDNVIIKETDGRSVDAYHMMKLFQKYGFESYFLHNPTKELFLAHFASLLAITRGYFVFFYTGNGKTVEDQQESIVFSDGELTENDLVEIINKNKSSQCTLLHLSDSCYDKCILNLEKSFTKKPENMISISCFSNEPEKNQSDDIICKHVEKGGNGVFAYHFWKTLTNNPKMTPNMLCSIIENDLKRHKQGISITTTNPLLLDQNLFY